MKNWTMILFLVWIVLSIVDGIALFANVPLFFSIAFAVLNLTVIIGAIPMFIQEFRDRKYLKMMMEEPEGEL